jgi:nucleotide-binding universal stress UspA family protein
MTANARPGGADYPMDRSTIVVGHDGSHGADQALAEALVLARALGGRVALVRAWSLATAPPRRLGVRLTQL